MRRRIRERGQHTCRRWGWCILQDQMGKAVHLSSVLSEGGGGDEGGGGGSKEMEVYEKRGKEREGEREGERGEREGERGEREKNVNTRAGGGAGAYFKIKWERQSICLQFSLQILEQN